MKRNKDEMRAEALKRMKSLQIFPTAVEEFKEEGKLNKSEQLGFLFWLTEEEQKFISRFECDGKFLVYHVIHDLYHMTDGSEWELYTLLFVNSDDREWRQDNAGLRDGEALCYCYNASDSDLSEFGYVGIRPSFGGVVRTW